MTQPEFANRLGVSAATIALWEGKESRPYSKEAEKFMAFEEAYDRGEVEPIQPDEVENWQKVFRGRRG